VKYTQTSRLIISVVNMMLYAVELVSRRAIDLVGLFYLLQVEILWHWLFIKKILTFLIKKINIIILKCRLFISLIARLLLVHNRKLLKQKKSLIIKQISAAKSKVLKYLDDIEERLIIEVESVQEKNEDVMFQSYNLVLLTYRKVKMNFWRPLKQSLKVKQTHKIYDSPRDKFYSIQHHVDYRNDQSARLCVFHSLFCPPTFLFISKA
jgi:hypothetical protein